MTTLLINWYAVLFMLLEHEGSFIRWKRVTEISKPIDTPGQLKRMSLGKFKCVLRAMRARWMEHETQYNEKSRHCHRPVSDWEDWGVSQNPGHSQRVSLNNWSMSEQWKQKHSLALCFPSLTVMCRESLRSISPMQSSTELKGLQVQFNYSASLQDNELLR